MWLMDSPTVHSLVERIVTKLKIHANVVILDKLNHAPRIFIFFLASCFLLLKSRRASRRLDIGQPWADVQAFQRVKRS